MTTFEVANSGSSRRCSLPHHAERAGAEGDATAAPSGCAPFARLLRPSAAQAAASKATNAPPRRCRRRRRRQQRCSSWWPSCSRCSTWSSGSPSSLVRTRRATAAQRHQGAHAAVQAAPPARARCVGLAEGVREQRRAHRAARDRRGDRGLSVAQGARRPAQAALRDARRAPGLQPRRGGGRRAGGGDGRRAGVAAAAARASSRSARQAKEGGVRRPASPAGGRGGVGGLWGGRRRGREEEEAGEERAEDEGEEDDGEEARCSPGLGAARRAECVHDFAHQSPASPPGDPRRRPPPAAAACSRRLVRHGGGARGGGEAPGGRPARPPPQPTRLRRRPSSANPGAAAGAAPPRRRRWRRRSVTGWCSCCAAALWHDHLPGRSRAGGRVARGQQPALRTIGQRLWGDVHTITYRLRSPECERSRC